MEFGIVGALGRMGRAISGRASFSDLKLVSPVEHAQHKDLGKKYSDVTGIPYDAVVDTLAKIHPPPGGFIDFSHATTVIHTLQKAAETGIPVVVGTTGFTAEQRSELEKMAAK